MGSPRHRPVNPPQVWNGELDHGLAERWVCSRTRRPATDRKPLNFMNRIKSTCTFAQFAEVGPLEGLVFTLCVWKSRVFLGGEVDE